MSDIIFEEAPKRRRRNALPPPHELLLIALKEDHPNEMARVKIGLTAAKANSLAASVRATAADLGGVWDIKARRIPGGDTYGVWAKYVEDGATETAEILADPEAMAAIAEAEAEVLNAAADVARAAEATEWARRADVEVIPVGSEHAAALDTDPPIVDSGYIPPAPWDDGYVPAAEATARESAADIRLTYGV